MISVAEAERLYDTADAVHDFDHVVRVLRLAERIGTVEGADMPVVRTAALLHDVGRLEAEKAGIDHAAAAAERARQILAREPRELADAVCHAVAAHRYRSEPSPSTLEARVVFDADKLDAIGAVGVARAFAYGGAHDQRLWAPVESVDVDRWLAYGDEGDTHTPVHEFVVKLSRIKDCLYTPTGQMIAAGRHDFVVSFFARLEQEVREGA